MKLLNSIITWIFRKRIGDVEEFVNHPHTTQKNLFHDLIAKGKTTEYGKKYNFSSIRSFSDYQQNVPITNYEDIYPYIERIMKGEQEILWPTKINWFAKSSGTTSGKSKFIPVSKETLEECHFKGGKDVMTLYCSENEDSLVFSGKSLIMGGSHQVNEMNHDSMYGDVSAVMMQNMPLLGHFVQTPGLEIALMDEWEEKLDKMVEVTVPQNVTSIAGVPTWTLVLLKKILEKTGKSDISEVWPNLELYTHGGVNFEPYRQQFQRLISNPKMNYYQMYNASEGFFAMQDSNDATDMLLMLDYGIFYEFIPAHLLGTANETTIPLSEVKAGEQYALVITTNSGLWRYNIGDTIEFTSVSPYRIKVTGRTKSFINAFGEEVIVENADYAIGEACKATNAVIQDYTAGPYYFAEGEQGTHEWFIEFEKEPDSYEEFARKLDNSLKETNTDYQAKRYKNLALTEPKIHFVPQGFFTQWLENKGKLGGQNKVPRLKNDRSLLEELHQLYEQYS